MLTNKFALTKKIDKGLESDYVAMCYPIKYKDDLKRENQVEMDSTKKACYLRLACNRDDAKKIFSSYSLPDDYRFVPMPYVPIEGQEERTSTYLSGAAGGGKSFLANQMSTIYHSLFPKNKIYFITTNDFSADKSLDKDLYTFVDTKEFLDTFKTKEAVAEFADTKKFNDSMFIFDDVGIVEKMGKEEDKALWAVIDCILENKRKNKISIIVISHVPTDFKKTRTLVREAKQYICFPKNQQVLSDRFLKTYLGLSSSQLDKIVNTDALKSNWVSIDNQRRLILTQRAVYFTSGEVQTKKIADLCM